MKKTGLILLCVFLIPSVASAIEIEVHVKSEIGGNIEYFEMNESVDSVQAFRLQWYNSESVSCLSRIEFKIYENGYVESAWSEPKKMHPGISEYFEAYWIPPHEGNYLVIIAIHHCQNIIESNMINFTVGSVPKPEETISIEAKNLPEKKIQVRLKAERDIKNVAVVPSSYPPGWVFNSKNVGDVKAGEEKIIELEYEPSVWSEESVNLQAISLDGRYSSEKIDFALKEERYFWDEYGYVLFLSVSVALAISLTLNFYLCFKRKK